MAIHLSRHISLIQISLCMYLMPFSAMAINIEDRFPSADQFWQTLNAQPAQPMTPVPPMVTPLPAANNAPVAPDEHELITPAPEVPGAANKALTYLTTQPQEITERIRRRGILPLLLLA